jgi:cytochrome P460
MLKDAQRYKNTDGWGWGRWRGEDLKPYGSDARFVNECTSCHMPVGSDDYVYTLPMTLGHVPGEEVANNQAVAMQSVNAHGSAPGPIAYTPGSVLALVTWMQREDPHWFGARIPAAPQSVEFVQAGAADKAGHYLRFSGSVLAEEHIPEDAMTKRMNFQPGLVPAWLP